MTSAELAKYVSETNERLDRQNAQIERLSAIVAGINSPVETGWLKTLSDKQEASIGKIEALANSFQSPDKTAVS